jgi:hypothetical protein
MKIVDNINEGPKFEFKLEPKEIDAWRNIQAMEATHNELGAALSAYRDSILEYRNSFVDHIAKKYQIKDRSAVTIDPYTDTIVSVYNKNCPMRIITVRSTTFKKSAADGMMGLIREIKALYIELLRERKKCNG